MFNRFAQQKNSINYSSKNTKTLRLWYKRARLVRLIRRGQTWEHVILALHRLLKQLNTTYMHDDNKTCAHIKHSIL